MSECVRQKWISQTTISNNFLIIEEDVFFFFSCDRRKCVQCWKHLLQADCHYVFNVKFTASIDWIFRNDSPICLHCVSRCVCECFKILFQRDLVQSSIDDKFSLQPHDIFQTVLESGCVLLFFIFDQVRRETHWSANIVIYLTAWNETQRPPLLQQRSICTVVSVLSVSFLL